MQQLKSGVKTFQLFINNFQHPIKLILIQQDNIYISLYQDKETFRRSHETEYFWILKLKRLYHERVTLEVNGMTYYNS